MCLLEVQHHEDALVCKVIQIQTSAGVSDRNPHILFQILMKHKSQAQNYMKSNKSDKQYTLTSVLVLEWDYKTEEWIMGTEKKSSQEKYSRVTYSPL